MTWKFTEIVRTEQNDFTKSFVALVSIENGQEVETIRLKFPTKPTKREINDAAAIQIDARNYVAPETDEARLKRRIEKLSRDGIPAKRLLDKLAEIV